MPSRLPPHPLRHMLVTDGAPFTPLLPLSMNGGGDVVDIIPQDTNTVVPVVTPVPLPHRGTRSPLLIPTVGGGPHTPPRPLRDLAHPFNVHGIVGAHGTAMNPHHMTCREVNMVVVVLPQCATYPPHHLCPVHVPLDPVADLRDVTPAVPLHLDVLLYVEKNDPLPLAVVVVLPDVQTNVLKPGSMGRNHPFLCTAALHHQRLSEGKVLLEMSILMLRDVEWTIRGSNLPLVGPHKQKMNH